MPHTLIICIGNVARRDDGVAHEVARLLTAGGLPAHVGLLTGVGLDVAFAADVAEATRVIVVDAERRESPDVVVSHLEPGTAHHSGHAIDAPGLLAVAEALWGASPEAVLVSVAAPDMGHGEGLSATAKAASIEAASTVRGLFLPQES